MIDQTANAGLKIAEVTRFGAPRSGATLALPTFSPATVLWMLGVGAASGLLFMILSAYAPDLRGRSDGGAHALSNSAVGYSGLVKLLKAEGVPVSTSRSQHPEREHPASLVILTPSFNSDLKSMTGMSGPGAKLIVLPKWLAGPDRGHPGWVAGGEPAPLLSVSKLMNVVDKGDHMLRRADRAAPVLKVGRDGEEVPAGQIAGFQTMNGPDRRWASVIMDQYGNTVLAQGAETNTYILADPDLLNNQGLAQLANAQGASFIIDKVRDGRPVVFDLSLVGFARTRSLLKLAFEPPFLSASLCALVAAALMGVHAAARFGAPSHPERAFSLGKRALADNSAALIRLVKREHRMGRGYAALTRTLTVRAVGAPRDLDDAQTNALLDRLGQSRKTEDAFTDLERQARDARDVATLMDAARKLYQWRLEITLDRS